MYACHGLRIHPAADQTGDVAEYPEGRTGSARDTGDGALQFDFDPIPAGRVRSAHGDHAGLTPSASQHPRPKPGGDLDWHVPEHVAPGHMDPDGGRIIRLWRVRYEQQAIPRPQAIDDGGAGSENRPVHVGPETRILRWHGRRQWSVFPSRVRHGRVPASRCFALDRLPDG